MHAASGAQAGLLLLLAFLLMPWPSQQLTNCGYCLCDRPAITCDFYKSKTMITDNIELTSFVPNSGLLRRNGLDPASYSEIYINCLNARVLKNQRLSRDLLKDFINLTRVSIVKCDLVSIEADALDALTQLKELDVSDNQLEKLPTGFLASKSLTVVRLSENPRLSLDAEPFLDASLKRLVLSRCEIAEFPLSSLDKIRGLQELTLSQNKIRFVPQTAKAFVTGLRVFYLDDNPLSCTCPNKWLREVQWNTLSPSLSKSPKAKLPRCKAPHHLLDSELSALSASDFPCTPPQLLSIDLQIGSESGRLACTAKSEEPSLLVWTYRQFAALSDASSFVPGGFGGRTYKGTGDSFVQSFERSRHASIGTERYQVSASTEDGRQTNFTLTVQWPPRRRPVLHQLPNLIDSSGSSGSSSSSSSQQDLLVYPPPVVHAPQPTPISGDYFSHKQFTLVQMIVAVIGTFLATSVMFLLGRLFTRWYSRRDKKRWANYVTHPYGYSYSGVSQQPPPGGSHHHFGGCGPPSHEYDIPRIDAQQLGSLPKLSGCGPGTLSAGSGGGGGMTELDFLDYNGSSCHQRIMYNRV